MAATERQAFDEIQLNCHGDVNRTVLPCDA